MPWIDWMRAADIRLLLAAAELDQPWLTALENIVFSEFLLALCVIAPLLWLLRRRGIPVMRWAVIYLALKAVVWSLKYLIDRPRPVEMLGLDSRLFLYPQNPSFPSGVAADMAVIAFLLGMLFPRVRVPLAALFLGIAFLRVTAAAHYPTDVIAGYLLGWLFLIVGDRVWAALRRTTAD